MSPISICTFSRFLNIKRLKFILCFMLSKIASTSQNLCFLWAIPSGLRSFCFAFALSLTKLWFILWPVLFSIIKLLLHLFIDIFSFKCLVDFIDCLRDFVWVYRFKIIRLAGFFAFPQYIQSLHSAIDLLVVFLYENLRFWCFFSHKSITIGICLNLSPINLDFF